MRTPLGEATLEGRLAERKVNLGAALPRARDPFLGRAPPARHGQGRPAAQPRELAGRPAATHASRRW